jgi:hypothetical protein
MSFTDEQRKQQKRDRLAIYRQKAEIIYKLKSSECGVSLIFQIRPDFYRPVDKDEMIIALEKVAEKVQGLINQLTKEEK